jgi:hypothetical protein
MAITFNLDGCQMALAVLFLKIQDETDGMLGVRSLLAPEESA